MPFHHHTKMKNVETLIHATLANVPLSPITREIMNWKKATHLPLVTWASEVKPAAEFKDMSLSKQVSATLRAGITYENMKVNEDKETGPLPWGEWENVNYTIAHKGQRYVRLTPSASKGQRPTSRFFADGVEVTREAFAAYLTPSEAKKLLEGESPTCFNVKESNLIGLGEIEA